MALLATRHNDGMSGEVDRLEPWQLPAYLRHLEERGTTSLTWNKDQVSLAEAQQRAGRLSDTATVVIDGTTIYVAEPDHSPDAHVAGGPGHRPLQLRPRPRT